jgi:hypothetical protein
LTIDARGLKIFPIVFRVSIFAIIVQSFSKQVFFPSLLSPFFLSFNSEDLIVCHPSVLLNVLFKILDQLSSNNTDNSLPSFFSRSSKTLKIKC